VGIVVLSVCTQDTQYTQCNAAARLAHRRVQGRGRLIVRRERPARLNTQRPPLHRPSRCHHPRAPSSSSCSSCSCSSWCLRLRRRGSYGGCCCCCCCCCCSPRQGRQRGRCCSHRGRARWAAGPTDGPVERQGRPCPHHGSEEDAKGPCCAFVVRWVKCKTMMERRRLSNNGMILLLLLARRLRSHQPKKGPGHVLDDGCSRIGQTPSLTLLPSQQSQSLTASSSAAVGLAL
jgi:hypothetical protein